MMGCGNGWGWGAYWGWEWSVGGWVLKSKPLQPVFNKYGMGGGVGILSCGFDYANIF